VRIPKEARLWHAGPSFWKLGKNKKKLLPQKQRSSRRIWDESHFNFCAPVCSYCTIVHKNFPIVWQVCCNLVFVSSMCKILQYVFLELTKLSRREGRRGISCLSLIADVFTSFWCTERITIGDTPEYLTSSALFLPEHEQESALHKKCNHVPSFPFVRWTKALRCRFL
jgi:hypothetical protein